jgi:hypothetical protein
MRRFVTSIFHKYYCGNQINVYEMGGEYSAHGRYEKCMHTELCPEYVKGKPRSRWEGNIKTHLKEIV